MKRLFILALTVQSVVLCPRINAQPGESSKYSSQRLTKSETLDDAKAILINNLFSYFTNNGMGALNPYTNDDGLEIKQGLIPVRWQGQGATMFSEGLVWGGYQRGAVKVGGATYNGGLQAGPILTPGTQATRPIAADRTQARYRVYRVRPDISVTVPADVAAALLSVQDLPLIVRYEQSMTARRLYDDYCRDWNEWPGAEGAPYTDVNHNGVYEPAIDIPGVPGAGQTLWYVANDMDSVRSKAAAGSLPIGIEMQRTVWAYHRPGALDNTIFQRTRIINKSGVPIDSMFLTQFADPDIGGSLGYTDDYIGCDTLRQMGFAYNATDNDGYYGAYAPAAGMVLLAGPMVPASAADSAFVNFSYRKGAKNLPMTSFVSAFKNIGDPYLNDPRGTIQYFNIMKGLEIAGKQLVNPETGKVTTFLFPGDPVARTGWIEGDPYNISGLIYNPADRRMRITSGPFTMAPSDTQEIVFAEMVGIGADRIGSVAALQSNADAVRKIFRTGFRYTTLPVPPAVRVVELNGRILLDWTDAASGASAESYANAGYAFQGYNVYQLPQGDFSRAERIATFDVIDDVAWVIDTMYDASSNLIVPKKTAFGTNSGLQHFYSTAGDSLTGGHMINGTKYYYAVTSYAYDAAASGGTKIIESAPSILAAVPQTPLPGHVLQAQYGQLLSNDASRVRSAGMKNSSVFVTVIDPTRITGHVYSFVFSDVTPTARWGVFDSTMKKFVISDQKQYARAYTSVGIPIYGTDPTDPVVDGLQFSVRYPPISASYQWTLSTAHLESTFSPDRAETDVQKINVYPNPYFAGNALESNKYEHFVTFNHLPQKAVINILTLTGVRVKAIVKNDPSQFLRWDLTNENGTQVAAGMYVVYISLPDLGTQKILKLAVIPAVTIPDHW